MDKNQLKLLLDKIDNEQLSKLLEKSLSMGMVDVHKTISNIINLKT